MHKNVFYARKSKILSCSLEIKTGLLKDKRLHI